MQAVAASSNNHNHEAMDAIETYKQRNIERNLKAAFMKPGAGSDQQQMALPPKVPTPPQAQDFTETSSGSSSRQQQRMQHQLENNGEQEEDEVDDNEDGEE